MWYRFNHWAYIDIFVYFGHYTVTLPPPGLVNIAHQHGVKVLGTLIFEWEAGAV
jgi:mannosyl-glycoprotein endo-beta-N-acetylglucosaminidase